MDRRNFFRIVSATSAGALATGCGRQADHLIPLLVPEHEIVPGEEQWHPAVCAGCGAGCGTLVRVMAGERVVERQGEKVRQRLAAIKKIEGNPLDPVSGGRLCARGQAAVQGLYHPDRLRGPLKRAGGRGSAAFAPLPWDAVLAEAAGHIARALAADPSRIVIVTGPQAGSRRLALERFAEALGAPAPVACSPADFAVERRAAELVFGWRGLPVYDLARAHQVLGVSADFLGGWASPVYYSRQFGHFRQGRPEVRGSLVQAESRLSPTAAAADRWLPLRPGTEPHFLTALARLLLDAGRGPAPAPAAETFQNANVPALLAACGLEERRVRELAQALAASEAPLILAGAAGHTNSLDAVVASHYLNLVLGNVGKPGGVLPPAGPPAPAASQRAAAEALARARIVLLAGANPAYTLPRSSGVLDALSRAEAVIGFGSMLDDSAAFADLLLPDHDPLESEIALIPAVAPQPAVNIGTPFVEPLYDTRPVERTLADLARKLDRPYPLVTARDVAQPLLGGGLSYEEAARQGGAWLDAPPLQPVKVRAAQEPIVPAAAEFAGDPARFPLLFQPYLSLQYHDGSASHLPWLQELPDPASSAIWGLPVEIDPATAAGLGVANGDVVRVESPHGSLEAPVYVHPGAMPGVASMGIGDGHTHLGRYASGRGANPLAILAPLWQRDTGALALGGTRVRLARVAARRDWIQFSLQDRRERGYEHR